MTWMTNFKLTCLIILHHSLPSPPPSCLHHSSSSSPQPPRTPISDHHHWNQRLHHHRNQLTYSLELTYSLSLQTQNPQISGAVVHIVSRRRRRVGVIEKPFRVGEASIRLQSLKHGGCEITSDKSAKLEANWWWKTLVFDDLGSWKSMAGEKLRVLSLGRRGEGLVFLFLRQPPSPEKELPEERAARHQ